MTEYWATTVDWNGVCEELRYHRGTRLHYLSMPLLLAASHHSSTGLREQNEDVAGLFMPADPELSTTGVIAAVADGVSGSEDGRAAAEYCVSTLLADYTAMSEELPVAEALDNAVQAINLSLRQLGHGRMATTLTSLVVRGNAYYFAHVGDTRLYLLRNGALQCLTSDHVGNHADTRHVLTRAIGLDARIRHDHGSGELQTGDIFLLASDGVWGALSDSDLEWHLSTLAEDPPDPGYTAKLLVDAALANGSKDNATAVVLRVLQLPDAKHRDPLARWKIIGALALLLNLLLLYWLVVG